MTTFLAWVGGIVALLAIAGLAFYFFILSLKSWN